jgi:hypothetical protein
MTRLRFGRWRRRFDKLFDAGGKGAPRVRFVPRLDRDQGREVYAASMIRGRRIALEDELLRNPGELRRIYIHELFHFVWVKLGNRRRWAFEAVLREQIQARGELGWSSQWRKRELTAADVQGRTRRWRDYCCEAFCDTAAWMFAGLKSHGEFTLARRHSERRADSLRGMMADGRFPI